MPQPIQGASHVAPTYSLEATPDGWTVFENDPVSGTRRPRGGGVVDYWSAELERRAWELTAGNLVGTVRVSRLRRLVERAQEFIRSELGRRR